MFPAFDVFVAFLFHCLLRLLRSSSQSFLHFKPFLHSRSVRFFTVVLGLSRSFCPFFHGGSLAVTVVLCLSSVSWPSLTYDTHSPHFFEFDKSETPTKPASKDKGILQRGESVASQREVPFQGSQQVSQKVGRVPPKKRVSVRKFVPRFWQCLETLVGTSDLMNGGIRQMDMDARVFGFPCTETIGQEDMEQIFLHGELGVSVMHSYIRMLFDKLMRENQLSNRFCFVSSSRVSGATIAREPDSVREHLVDRFMTTASIENLYLLAYNSGCQWLFLAIDPIKEVVYYLNSVDGDWTNYPEMKLMIDTSIQVFQCQREARVPRYKSNNINWIKVQCPQQQNDVDCGYFVLRFIKEIIQMNEIEISITYFDEYKCPYYSKLQLEELKEELCQYFIEQRIL